VNGWISRVRVQLVREGNVRASRVQGPQNIVRLFLELVPEDEPVESFVVFCLDTQNRITACGVVTRGILNASLVHPREVFQRAILANSASIICAHNHPSGDPDPSPEDIEVTAQLVAAGRIVGIPVRDHVITGAAGSYVSMLERGLLSQLPKREELIPFPSSQPDHELHDPNEMSDEQARAHERRQMGLVDF